MIGMYKGVGNKENNKLEQSKQTLTLLTTTSNLCGLKTQHKR